MNSIFDDLYYDNVHPLDQACSAEYQAKQKEFAFLEEKLNQLLDLETQNQLFDRTAQLEDILCREAFAAGIRLGSRFMLELLNGAS